MSLFQWVQVAGITVVVVGAAWAVYTGFLPRKLKELIGYYELREDVKSVREHTAELRSEHSKTLAELENLKAGQVAIAETVTDEYNGDVDVERLRAQHFSGDSRPRPADFLGED